MMWQITVLDVATLIIIIGGILIATRSPGKHSWLFSKKVIRTCVLVSAFVAFGVNEYRSRQDEQEKYTLKDTLDSLDERLKIFEKAFVRISDENSQTVSESPTSTLESNKKGNVAGFVKSINGEGLAGVTITRVANNVQTTSHEGGEFIVASVAPEEVLRFEKQGYKDFNYKVKQSDFDRLVEIKIKED